MTAMMTITSRDNEKIKDAVRLVTSSRYRRETSRFVTEGARLCEDAARSGTEIFELYCTRRACERYGDTVDALTRVAGQSYLISEDVSAKLCDTQSPQGIYCVCGMRPDTGDGGDVPQGKLIGLERIQDPSNLGAIIRTAAALGIDCAVLDGCCDIYNPKALRASMGAILRQRLIRTDSMAEFVRRCERAGVRTFAAVLSQEAVPINEADFSGSVLTVIGNEGAGVTAETRDVCGGHVIIPMENDVESLNAAVAAGIIMWAEASSKSV